MFQVTKSPNGMQCISIVDPTKEQVWYLKRALQANHSEDPFYVQKCKAHPFLQSDHRDYVLVEFWTDQQQVVANYVKFLNDNFDQEVNRFKRLSGELID